MTNLVLMSPLQLDHDSLASEAVEEGLWVHGHRRHPGSRIALCNVRGQVHGFLYKRSISQVIVQ